MQEPSTNAGSNANMWDSIVAGTTLNYRAVNDADTAATNWLAVTRTGTAISSIGLGGPTKVTGTFGASSGGTFGTATHCIAAGGLQVGASASCPSTFAFLAQSQIGIEDSSGSTDQKLWDFLAPGGSGTLVARAVSDGNTAAFNWLTVARSGYSISSITFPTLTDSALTSGNCVQASTGGLLADSGQPCVTRLAHYWNVQPGLFATATMLGPAYIADSTPSGSAFYFVVRLSGTISCTTGPTVNIMDLGTSPTTAYGSATSAFSQGTGTSDGVYFTNSPVGTILGGHYYGLAFSAGTCVTAPTVDVTLNW